MKGKKTFFLHNIKNDVWGSGHLHLVKSYLWTQKDGDSLGRWVLSPSLGSEWQTATLWSHPSRGRRGNICCILGRQANAHETVICYCDGRQQSDNPNRSWMLMLVLSCLLKHVSAWKSILFSLLYCWLPPSEDIYTHQMDVFHDMQPNADQGQGICLRDSDHITVPIPTN